MKLPTIKQLIKLTLQSFCALIILALLNPVLAADAKGQNLQNYKVNLSLESASVAEVLAEIEAQTSFNFVYDRNVGKLDNTYSFNHQGVSIRGVLEILAKDAQISFKRVNQTIAVNANQKESPQVVEVIFQSVQGTVSDDSGVPLAGATIMEKGTSNGVTTDFDGNFSINVEPGATLVVSYLGYLSQEIVVTDQSSIDVQMIADAALLGDVVVVGYGNQKKASVSGSIASVSSESFNKGIVSNPGQLLQGKVAGVNVSVVSGEPGASQDVIIRGIGSLRSGTTPLYVVDGFTLDNSGIGVANNPLNFINSNDIESIEVLKDASATAIYGSRAANGVIVITTKKGQKGKTEMNLSVSTAISTLANRIDVYNADEFRNQVREIGGKLSD